jgi:predicted Zn-dependent protease
VARRDGPGLEAAIARFPRNAETAFEAEVLGARLRHMCGDVAGARRMLEDLIAQQPRRLSPRLALCNLLLQAGDWPAAEQALRGVLAIDPNSAVCRKNLETLLRQ